MRPARDRRRSPSAFRLTVIAYHPRQPRLRHGQQRRRARRRSWSCSIWCGRLSQHRLCSSLHGRPDDAATVTAQREVGYRAGDAGGRPASATSRSSAAEQTSRETSGRRAAAAAVAGPAGGDLLLDRFHRARGAERRPRARPVGARRSRGRRLRQHQLLRPGAERPDQHRPVRPGARACRRRGCSSSGSRAATAAEHFVVTPRLVVRASTGRKARRDS